MCSGCSGDYAGGFDSDDFDEAIAGARDSVSFAGFHGTSEEDLGGKNLDQNDLDEAHSAEGGRPAGLELPEDAMEACEILVTGTHIVEVRVIWANSQARDQQEDWQWRMRAALSLLTPGKHSTAKSAKYYRTCLAAEKASGYATGSPGISRWFSQRFAQFLAGACKTKLGRSLQKTRRFVRGGTPLSI